MEVRIATLVCPDCGTEFYLKPAFAKLKQNKSVHCPNGHMAILRLVREVEGTVK